MNACILRPVVPPEELNQKDSPECLLHLASSFLIKPRKHLISVWCEGVHSDRERKTTWEKDVRPLQHGSHFSTWHMFLTYKEKISRRVCRLPFLWWKLKVVQFLSYKAFWYKVVDLSLHTQHFTRGDFPEAKCLWIERYGFVCEIPEGFFFFCMIPHAIDSIQQGLSTGGWKCCQVGNGKLSHRRLKMTNVFWGKLS